MYYIGLDIGSISVNAVLMTLQSEIRQEHYFRTLGQPLETTLKALKKILSNTPKESVAGIAVTGTGGALPAKLLNGFFFNEIIAQSKATSHLHPEIRSIIELGGEDSKLIRIESDGGNGCTRIKDFAMNTVCAAGTGSFLDQQAVRLGVNIENEFGLLAAKSTHPPRIAGRCSVFAKSDMIHLQQVAAPDYDIIMGLCMALARNFRSNLAKGVELEKPVAFQGGVAANRGMIRAFEMVFELKRGELMVPCYFASMGAIGAVLTMVEKGGGSGFSGTDELENYLQNRAMKTRHLEPLVDRGHRIFVEPLPVEDAGPVDAYLGVDVGSISTNLVLIDKNRRVIARRYLMTAGRPIEAVRQGLLEIGDEMANWVAIEVVTTSGSGRYCTGDFIGADFVKNEITAHARGAANINPLVDTIFEIGGQDSKYISLENGAVVDFTMNKVCAAGTGSFLEEQAEKLGINIKEEFGRLALSSNSPVSLGERCTVFMESSLNHNQQLGVAKQDLAAGLSYSIVQNYFNRVVEGRKIGDVVFFQGGTAHNRGVKAAFEKVCGKKITVPPHHDVLGALGAAIIALENRSDGPSAFKGFDLAKRRYSVESFECSDCPNNCEIRKVFIEGEKVLYYGSRCEKHEKKGIDKRGNDIPDMFEEREKLLLEEYRPLKPVPDNAPSIGIPRATLFFETYPFWKAFFSELGFRILTSPATNRKIISRGCEVVVEEICFPIKVAHGHILELMDQKPDYLFLPSIINMEQLSSRAEVSYNCLYVQSLPYIAWAAIDFDRYQTKVLKPVIHFEWGKKTFIPELQKLAKEVGCQGKVVTRAIDAAIKEENRFRKKLVKRGKEILESQPEDRQVIVLISRPYNGCDSGLNFQIPDKIRKLGALALPLDFLPVSDDSGQAMQAMYWRYGQRILSAAGTIVRSPRMNAVYISNFGCGPDSFITKHFNHEMRGKPYLAIELDEHSADTGVITRLEAFFDSIQSIRFAQCRPKPKKTASVSGNHRKIYVPHMDDHGRTLAAAMRYNGLQAEALPMADEKTIEIGRKHTTGKECFPCIITTGDIVKKTLSEDFDPDRSSFFMPSARGPCRFGQYSIFHRMVLDSLGFENVPLVVLDQTADFAANLSSLGNGFRRLAWQSFILVDYIKKLMLQTRPYETSKGDSDTVYEECLKRLMKTIEQDGAISDCGKYAVERFSSLPVNRKERKPLIGIIGEIFIRSNSFSNNFIVRRIEDLGGEVIMPTMQEWIEYTDWERRKDLQRQGNMKEYMKEAVTRRVQQNQVCRIGKPFKSSIRCFFREVPTEKTMKLCSDYLDESIRGEATLSMGRALEYAEHGFSGVVNLIPFNCMPGTIVNTLLRRFSSEYPHLPLLKMVYDGNIQSSAQTRIEAFMYQARKGFES